MKNIFDGKIRFILNVLFYVFIAQAIIMNVFIAKGPHVAHRVVFLLLLFLTIKSLKIKSIKIISSAVISLLVAADTTISTLTWLSFDSPFNDGFALSVLGSNSQEMIAMTGLYIGYFFLFLLMATVFFIKAMRLKPLNKGTVINSIVLILLVVFTFQSVKYVQHRDGLEGKEEKTWLLVMARLSSYLPVFNASYILTAWHQLFWMEKLTNSYPDYHFNVLETNIDTYVLVLGESERIWNMGIYGYEKETTPQLEAEQHNLMLFRHAISSAPITNVAVPLALSAATIDDHRLETYSDNIINMANAAGFYTSWISAQSAFSSKGSPVASIAYNAKDKLYLTGYDASLLTHFEEVLARPEKKKFIVLHLYGSHEPQCTRYPESEAVFTQQNDGINACYDNSVLYTDSILGKVFSLLNKQKASVFYFSDHALEKDARKSGVYFHGGTNPSKEAYQVPMFIWYSPVIHSTWQGSVVDDRISTSGNNLLLKSWLGLDSNNDFAPLIKQQQPVDKVLNSASSVLRFSTLRDRVVE